MLKKVRSGEGEVSLTKSREVKQGHRERSRRIFHTLEIEGDLRDGCRKDLRPDREKEPVLLFLGERTCG